MPLVLTRRMVFTLSGVTLAGACASPKASGGSPDSPARAARSDAARDRALAAEADLLARYDAALALPAVAADSALTAKLTAIRAEHASHAAAIRDGYQAGATPAPTGTPSSPAPSSSTNSPATPSGATTAPPDAKSALAALIKAEQDAADARTADILAADGGTAMLLASVAASESGHAALLLGGAA
ncbi:hypothetical protein GCM10009838_87720 [Catenulispora subtropica]|uniref:Ferritin-like domain-containing protein n=2 Tax=Catenulispora subtropica TaxID=450798 RepID=A0ABN2THB5_9ACTN